MEKLILEVKGGPKSAVYMLLFSGLLMPVLGVIFIILSQMKRSTHAVYTGVSGTMSYAGSFGGGYVVSEEARTVMIVAGIVLIGLGIAILSGIPSISKTTIKVFDNHIEGCIYIPIIIGVARKDFLFQYSEISGMQNVKNVLVIHSAGKVKRIALKDEQTVMQVVQAIQQATM